MNVSSVGQEQQTNKTSRKFNPILGAFSLACTPLTEVAFDARKVSKLEKSPYKDAFMKCVEKEGKDIQGFFKSLEKSSPKNIGWTYLVLGTAIDAVGTYLLAGWLSNLISSKLNKQK